MAHYYKGDQPTPSRPPQPSAWQPRHGTGGRPPQESGQQPAAQQNWQPAPQPGWTQNPGQTDAGQHPSGPLPAWQHPSGPLPGWQDPAPPPPKKSPFTRWWFLAALGVLLIVVVAVIATSGDTADNTTDSGGGDLIPEVGQSAADTPADDTAASTPTPPATTEAPIPADDVLSDGGWTVDSIQLSESLGNFSGTMRVTNTDTTTRTGFFTLTMLLDGAVVGTAIGVANDVEPGSTGTVQLLSSDPFVTGDLTYEFQTEF